MSRGLVARTGNNISFIPHMPQAFTVNTPITMMTILLVDDDLPILDLLTEMLEDCGHAILRAINGQEAIEIASQAHPDIIITDIMMPVMNGYELLKAVRSTPQLADICVFLASAGISDLRSCNEPINADGYIQKPFNLTEIEQLVHGKAANRAPHHSQLRSRVA